MNTNSFVLFAFLLSVFTACSNDDDTTHASLCFEQAYYEKPLVMSEPMRRIPFTGGSGDFSLSVSNKEVLDAEMANGYVYITPKEKGRTNIEVHDNVDDRSVTIQVKVVAPYICLHVGNPLPDGKPDYGSGDYLFLVNDSKRSVYWFSESFNLNGTEHGYSFYYVKELRAFYFSLPLAGDVFTYDITGAQPNFLVQWLPKVLGISWDGLYTQGRATAREIVSEIVPNVVPAVDTATGEQYYFVVNTSIEMPYGILD